MGVSIWQILLVVGIIVLLFGARRLPELGKSLGEAINGFKKGISDDDNSIDVTDSSKEKIEKGDAKSTAGAEEKATEKA